MFSRASIFKALFESAAEGIVLVDEMGSIVMANPRLLDMFQYQSRELLGQTIEKLIPARFVKNHEKYRKDYFKKPEKRTMGTGRTLFGIRKDGSEFPLEASLNYVEFNNETFVVGLITDITTRMEMQQKLIQQKQRTDHYFESAGVMFIVLDANNSILRLNQTAYYILGLNLNEDIKGTNFIQKFIPKNKQERFIQHLDELRSQKTGNIYFEERVVTEEKLEKDVAFNGTGLKPLNGDQDNILLSGDDITVKIKQQSAVFQALIEGQERERRRIAEELHDGLGPMISTARLSLDNVSELNEKTSAGIDRSKDLLDKVMYEMRGISHNLLPPGLEEFGLKSSLSKFLADLEKNSKMAIDLSFFKVDERLEANLEFNFYRIVQELAHNALKHSEAKKLSVQFVNQGDSLNLFIEDDGKGFEYKKELLKEGIGLKNIETRVKSLSGDWYVDSSPNSGTAINIDIPLTEQSWRNE